MKIALTLLKLVKITSIGIVINYYILYKYSVYLKWFIFKDFLVLNIFT